MKIRNVRVTPLRFVYPDGQGFDFAGGRCTGRLTCLIRIACDTGEEGLGSVYSHPRLVREVVEGQLRDFLVGEDPREVEALWARMYSVTRWYGRKGAAMSALGGVDMALWDLRGKAAGKPLYQLLGAVRDWVPAYASGLLWKDDPRELGDEARRHLANGFRAMKTRLGRNYQYDSEALRVFREVLTGKARLHVDGNGRYSLEQARRMIPEFKKADIFWLEEPFMPEDVDNYLALKPDLNGIPMAAGENEFGVQGFRELIDRGMVDIVQPDCCRVGGITESRRVGEMAAKAGLRVAPHTWSDAVALAGNMHVVASLKNGVCVEVDQTGNPFIDELLAEKLKVVDGEIALPQGPGLGIALNEDVVERYAIPAGEAVPAGNYSDMVFGRENYAPAGPYNQG
jgi:D-galactarolactone cycloisomerase